ncbi:MAG TPA: DNA mismatch repair protein MutS [Polyangiaceae bacterium]|nr:DNA mismatch repair protein MutS [Polyangiaceae bacterium]
MTVSESAELLKARRDFYRERERRFSAAAGALGARSRLISNLRGLSFAVLVVTAIWAFIDKSFVPGGAIALVAGLAFAVLVVIHGRVLAREDDQRRWARVNHDGELRVTGKWGKLPEDGSRFASEEHAYAADLDVFGKNSLFQRINVAHTRYGQERLADYLRRPTSPSAIRQRQEAVRALAAAVDLRQELEALSLAVVERPTDESNKKQEGLNEPPDPEPLLRWAESEPELSRDFVTRFGAPVLPVLVVAGIVLNVQLGLPSLLWLLPFLGNFFILVRARKVTEKVFNAVSVTEGAFLRYGAMLELVEKSDVKSELTESLQKRLLSGEQRPSAGMQEFRRKVGWFDLRHSGLVHPFAALFLLWDVNCVLALERWQRRTGKGARGWFEALGEFEALSSLAGLVDDEPGCSFPEIEESRISFEATRLGHVLIPADRRVKNDVILPRAGTALLVTGSNMSGKSTFLRAMGLSAVLAYAGAPVIASRLRLSLCAVCTSIRISDSLGSGVSHFYAELNKLKAVVDATRGKHPVFFLLDEILHGTNSLERQIGARWVLAELLEHQAIGVVTTHDMELCRLSDELMTRVEQAHFRESVTNDQMTFDYTLRPGPVTAGNALRLMRLLGLNVPLQESAAEGPASSQSEASQPPR